MNRLENDSNRSVEFWNHQGKFRGRPHRGLCLPEDKLFGILPTRYENTVWPTEVWTDLAKQFPQSVQNQPVLELCGGSGPVYEALLRTNKKPSLYVNVEKEYDAESFFGERINALKRMYPKTAIETKLIAQDVTDPHFFTELQQKLRGEDGSPQKFDYVCSAFGIVNFPEDQVKTLLSGIRDYLLTPDGQLFIMMMDGVVSPKKLGIDYSNVGIALIREKPLEGLGYWTSLPQTVKFGLQFRKLYSPYRAEEMQEMLKEAGYSVTNNTPTLKDNAAILTAKLS